MLIYKYILGTKEILKDMDTQQILVNQEKMVDIFRDNRWKNGMNIYQREKIITEFFYYNIWQQINPENRIYLLQEFENIQAKKQERDAYRIIVLSEEYNFDQDFFDMKVDYVAKKIYLRRNYIEKGIKQIITKYGIEKCDISNRLNAELLDGIIHEAYHICSKQEIREKIRTKKPLNIDEKEIILWLKMQFTTNKQNNNQIIKNQRYLYRMKPQEYYAFKVAKHSVDIIFNKLERKFGIDIGYQEYLQAYYKEIHELEKLYEKDKNETLYYEEIYKRIFLENIERFISRTGKKGEKMLSILGINQSNYQIYNSEIGENIEK